MPTRILLGGFRDSFCRLTALQELHLRGTGLKEVPGQLRLLKKLRVVDLRGNDIRILPEWLSELPKLWKLDLRWNRALVAPPWLKEMEARGGRVLL